MPDRISRIVLRIETIVIALPLSILLFIAASYELYWTFRYFLWPNVLNAIFGILASVATISGYVLINRFLKFGATGLQTIKRNWWIFAFFGVVLSIASGISLMLPPSAEYSIIKMFRDDFERFVLGVPLWIPLTHLVLERNFRK